MGGEETGSLSVAQVGLEFFSASQVLGLQMCTTMLDSAIS
jgi:hypothetical protein